MSKKRVELNRERAEELITLRMPMWTFDIIMVVFEDVTHCHWDYTGVGSAIEILETPPSWEIEKEHGTRRIIHKED